MIKKKIELKLSTDLGYFEWIGVFPLGGIKSFCVYYFWLKDNSEFIKKPYLMDVDLIGGRFSGLVDQPEANTVVHRMLFIVG